MRACSAPRGCASAGAAWTRRRGTSRPQAGRRRVRLAARVPPARAAVCGRGGPGRARAGACCAPPAPWRRGRLVLVSLPFSSSAAPPRMGCGGGAGRRVAAGMRAGRPRMTPDACTNRSGGDWRWWAAGTGDGPTTNQRMRLRRDRISECGGAGGGASGGGAVRRPGCPHGGAPPRAARGSGGGILGRRLSRGGAPSYRRAGLPPGGAVRGLRRAEPAPTDALSRHPGSIGAGRCGGRAPPWGRPSTGSPGLRGRDLGAAGVAGRSPLLQTRGAAPGRLGFRGGILGWRGGFWVDLAGRGVLDA